MAARPKDSFAAHAVPVIAVPLAFLLSAASAGVASLREPEPETRREAMDVDDVVDAIPDDAPGRDFRARARRRPLRRLPPGAAPIEWRPMRSMKCFQDGEQRFCDGPLQVPARHGPAAALATRLGLDDERRVGPQALHQPPDPVWLSAVEGESGAGLSWPVPEGRMWRGYGVHPQIDPQADGRLRESDQTRLHPGVDIGAPEGSAVRAVDDGLVLYSYNGMHGYGNCVELLHPDGTVTLYAHLSAALVFAGQQVRRGQVIAEVGHTGLAHGDHLHLEWRRDGQPLNPAPFFVEVPAPPGAGAR